jgi:uncharacterized protein (TIGR02611 family)
MRSVLVSSAVQLLRRVAVAAAGALLLGIGLLLLVLPGPGTLVIVAGMALLSTEFVWARRALDRMKTTISNRTIRRSRTQSEETSREMPR